VREELVKARNEAEHLLRTLNRLLDVPTADPTAEDLEIAKYLAYRIHRRLKEMTL